MDFKKRPAVAISLLRIYYCQMSAHLWPPVIELRAASVTQAPSPMARKQNSFAIERPELPSRILPPTILEPSGASFPGAVSPPLRGFSRGRRPEKSASCPPNQSSPAAALPSLSPLSHPSVSGSHLPPRPARLIPRSPVPPSLAPASLPLPPVSLPALTSSSARVLDSPLRLCYPVSRPAICPPLLADCLLSRQRVSRISLSKIVCMRTEKESGLTYRMWERADMMGDEWTSWGEFELSSRAHRIDGITLVSSSQLRDDLLSVLVAGHETTGSVLTWTLYLLSKNPSSLVRAQQEVDEVLQGRLPSYEDVKALKS
ncbi:cytochrome P450 [Asimina triloba]